MSWFSRRIGASFGSQDSRDEERASDDEDDDHHPQQQQERQPIPSLPLAHGKGVKEDLSELTKTFTRQLWGVASFLAPPPQAQLLKHTDDDLAPPSTSQLVDPLNVGTAPLPAELVDVDLRTSKDDALQGVVDEPYQATERSQDQPLHVSSEEHDSSAHALTGIGKDFAELKGSVATGFSRIMKAVREELDEEDELSSSIPDQEYASDAEVQESTETLSQIPGFNYFLRPLLGSILHEDRETSLLNELKGDDKEEGDQSNRLVQVRKSITLHRTLGDGLEGISKLASTLFPANLDSDEDDAIETRKAQQAVGVSDEVLTFARNISMHPETWMDFPLFTDYEYEDEFEMSDAQKQHIHQVELAAPRFAALRMELCPGYMSEGRFLKIYFVLLHSRLSKEDAAFLSTPEILEARKLLLSKLEKGEASQGSKSEREESFKIVSLQAAMEVPPQDFDGGEDLAPAGKGQPHNARLDADCAEEVQNKTVLANTVKLASSRYEDDEADADRWLDEEGSPPHTSSLIGLPGNDDDVSFSDLEEDEDATSKAGESSGSQRSTGWVQLDKTQDTEELANKGKALGLEHGQGIGESSTSKLSSDRVNKRPETGESSDWSTVEDDDVTSADFE